MERKAKHEQVQVNLSIERERRRIRVERRVGRSMIFYGSVGQPSDNFVDEPNRPSSAEGSTVAWEMQRRKITSRRVSSERSFRLSLSPKAQR